jgi:hypothetical protein
MHARYAIPMNDYLYQYREEVVYPAPHLQKTCLVEPGINSKFLLNSVCGTP